MSYLRLMLKIGLRILSILFCFYHPFVCFFSGIFLCLDVFALLFFFLLARNAYLFSKAVFRLTFRKFETKKDAKNKRQLAFCDTPRSISGRKQQQRRQRNRKKFKNQFQYLLVLFTHISFYCLLQCVQAKR